MMTAEDVGRVMIFIVPVILIFVIAGLAFFLKWSKKDRGVDDWKDIRKD
jgi:cbb3-type cytochrome oxidase maturation protein